MSFSPGRKGPKVPCGQRFACLPFTKAGSFTHDKILASSNGRIHQISKSFLFCGPFSEKVERRQGAHSPGGQEPPRHLLAEFSLRPASKKKLFSLYIFRALSADTRKRPFPERHSQPFGQGLFVSFSPGKKKREMRKGRIVAVYSAGIPVLFHFA